jgi:hypothetical protein
MSNDADVMTDIEVLKAVEEIRQLEARYARYADEKALGRPGGAVHRRRDVHVAGRRRETAGGHVRAAGDR